MLEAVLAVIVALAAAFGLGRWRGGRAARDKREAQDARDYQSTMERMHNADTGRGDASDARWLRERADKR